MATGSGMMNELELAKSLMDRAGQATDPKEKFQLLSEAAVLSLKQIPQELRPALSHSVDRTITVITEMREGMNEEATEKAELISHLSRLQDGVAELRLDLMDGKINVDGALEKFLSRGDESIDDLINKISNMQEG